jgi:hypothetical protein
MIDRLESRSYTTYLCRLNASRRLAQANFAWNLALVALSTSTTIASVGILAARDMYGAGGDALMVALAVLSLVVSLVVSGVGFGTRARAMEENYKRIQQISVAAENLKGYTGQDRREKYEKLQWEYEVAVASSENHTQRDYRKMVAKSSVAANRGKWQKFCDCVASFGYVLNSAFPYISLVAPIALLVPFGIWFGNGV